ncbi:hypothetical protein, partial [Vibrio sp. 10N.222.54.B2]|uniref:hypothetical protein n=1 Tax=Vibrio sp. 10N.222.54.B2 TaxID=3229637 RepID=UPI00354FBE8E
HKNRSIQTVNGTVKVFLIQIFKSINYELVDKIENYLNANNSNYHLDPILYFANQDNTMELR